MRPEEIRVDKAYRCKQIETLFPFVDGPDEDFRVYAIFSAASYDYENFRETRATWVIHRKADELGPEFARLDLETFASMAIEEVA